MNRVGNRVKTLLCGSAVLIGVVYVGISDRDTSLSAGTTAVPQSAAGHQPKICLSWNPVEKSFGWDGWQETSDHFCPINYAIYATDDQTSGSAEPRYSYFTAGCCPLPADDILTSESTLEWDGCPEDAVITGMTYMPAEGDRPITKVRCTKINTTRYRLGEKRPGAYWGVGSGIHSYGEKHAIKISDVPAAIRSSIGRRSFSGWDSDGCIGEPAGSLITVRSVTPCSDSKFRELQFAGAAGDPVAGTPVKMFPECTRISDIFDPNASCIDDFEKTQ